MKIDKVDIVFVILHYNTIGETISCVDSIKQLNNNEKIKIIIVDNKSPNNTGVELKKKYINDNRIEVLLNNNNTGFSSGNNYGYKYMKEKYNTDFVIFCNNDIIFTDKDIITKIKKVYQDEKFYVLGPDIYNPNDNVHQSPIPIINSKLWRVNITIILNTISLKLFNLYWSIIKLKNKNNSNNKQNNNKNNNLKRINNVPLMGACLIFSKEFINERKKVFEPETFMYYEEYILHYWCNMYNKKTIFEPDILVYHNDGIATKSIKDTEKNKCRFRMEKILESAKIYRKIIKDKK